MPSITPIQKNSLVLYKMKPARVTDVEEKRAEIETQDGSSIKVRHKDFVMLHPGPIARLSDLTPLSGDIEAACELLEGQTATLPEIAELIYGSHTPSSAWEVVQLIQNRIYMYGSVDEIHVRTCAERESEEKKRSDKAAEKEAWDSFIARLRSGSSIEDDHSILTEVEEVAIKKSTNSPILKALDYPVTPEGAHQLLLKLKHWDETRNPYPDRCGLPQPSPPELPVIEDEERLDLTHLQAYAIDDDGNKDPDDAVSIEGNKLWVHVSDVSSAVTPDSPADLNAREQGATAYLPEHIRNMLPPAAAELFGLGMQEKSPSLSFGITLNEAGGIDTVEIHAAWVRVNRMTYTEAEKELDTPPFSEIAAVTNKFREYRKSKNAAFLDFPETKIKVEEGKVVIRPLPRLGSRNLVSESMIMAGEAAAKFALENGFTLPFTSQDPPETPASPETLSAMHAYRRQLRPGKVTAEPLPHAGLGLQYYCKVTSPLRRYGDLLAHQQIRAFLKRQDLMKTEDILMKIGSSQSGTSAVMKAERLSNLHWTLVYLLQNPEWTGTGIVVENRERYDEIIIPELGMESRITTGENLTLDSEIPIKPGEIDLPKLYVRFQRV